MVVFVVLICNIFTLFSQLNTIVLSINKHVFIFFRVFNRVNFDFGTEFFLMSSTEGFQISIVNENINYISETILLLTNQTNKCKKLK